MSPTNIARLLKHNDIIGMHVVNGCVVFFGTRILLHDPSAVLLVWHLVRLLRRFPLALVR